jgi:hypothetical protein
MPCFSVPSLADLEGRRRALEAVVFAQRHDRHLAPTVCLRPATIAHDPAEPWVVTQGFPEMIRTKPCNRQLRALHVLEAHTPCRPP